MNNIENCKREAKDIYKGKHAGITANFLAGTLKARRAWNGVFQALKENNCQPRFLYPAKLFFIIEGEIKTINDKQKLK
jgi:hypothetical protein